MEVPSQHGVWETIAASFDASRRRTWPHVLEFLDGLDAGSRVLDLMAGNGRHTAPAAARHDVVWCDWSRPLARLAQAKPAAAGAGFVVADATRLPFAAGCFDACIYVAGLHGIPSAEGRQASMAAVARTLRPGGRLQVTVWSRDAPSFADRGEPGQALDVLLPWRSDGHDEQRFYHLYTPDGLAAEAQQAGLEVERLGEVDIIGARDNIVLEARRPGPL